MHHYKSYMYINFQQNLVGRSVKTVHTNLFAKIRKLHKFATTNSIVFKIDSFRHASSKTFMHISFQQNRVSYAYVSRTSCLYNKLSRWYGTATGTLGIGILT